MGALRTALQSPAELLYSLLKIVSYAFLFIPVFVVL